MALPTFTFSTTAEEVATALADEIKGKNVLITGTSLNGIGFEAARTIAKHANLVIITGYNAERLALSEQAIKKDVPSANIRPLTLDLSSLAAVRAAAAEVNAYAEPLHVLIHNAAGNVGAFTLTPDGLESQLATAHVGPFLLTTLLRPKLLATRTSTYTPRVVFVASEAHTMAGTVDVARLAHPDAATYNNFATYAHAKCTGVTNARELTRRAKGQINAYSVHPGVIFTNLFQRKDGVESAKAAGILDSEGQPNPEKYTWKSIPQGAASIVAAAFDTRLNATPGSYIVDSKPADDQVAAYALDPAHATALWETTETIIGEKCTFTQSVL
ncbi:hypothetical protein C8R43DRAFT_1043151 [Mycena crocata]|nr:hypothetical protein C8R43DRAFT_1043151 [Mycena crocata]